MSMERTEEQLEAHLSAKAKSAVRITPEMLDAVIVGESYHVFQGTTTTVCCLMINNGYTLIGHSACVDPANFDADIGRQIARSNAREQLWPLLGFCLRDAITAAGA